MLKRTLICGLFFCLCLNSQMVRGEEQQAAWWVSPSVGFSFFDNSSGIEDNPVFGIGTGTKINERWNFEGTLSYLNSETRGTPHSDLEIYQLALSLLYDLPHLKKLTPYLLIGGGGIYADSDEFGNKTGGLLHYGAGLRYNLNSNLTVKGEVRHQVYLGLINDKGERKTVQNLTTLVGLDLRFNQPHQPVVATLLPASAITVRPIEPPAVAEEVTLPEELNDNDLEQVGNRNQRPEQLSKKSTPPGLTITPRFNPGAVELLSLPPQDMTTLKNFFEDQPQARVVIMGDIDEKTMCYAKYKIQEQRAQRVRIFLIDTFGIAPEKIKIMTQQSWRRAAKSSSRNQTLIRFAPVENQTRVAIKNP